MRAWRKIHAGLLGSEKAELVSDGALALFCILVIAQDDEGKYPWTPVKIKRLTACRDWSAERCQELADELIGADLCRMHEEFLVIVGGADKNGLPRDGRQHLIYERRITDPPGHHLATTTGAPGHHLATTTGAPGHHLATTTGAPVARGEERRGREDTTPIGVLEVEETEAPASPSPPVRTKRAKTAPGPARNLEGFSEDARCILLTWSKLHGRPVPKLNPAQGMKLEQAVAELGRAALEDACRWTAEKAIPEFYKVVSAARTRAAQPPARASPNGGAQPGLRDKFAWADAQAEAVLEEPVDEHEIPE